MKLIDLLSEKSAFLFDFDGVVTDSEIYSFSVLRSIVKDNYGIDIDDEDIEYTIGLDANGTADAISRKYSINLSGDEFISFLSEYPVYYTDYECNHHNISDKVKIVFINIEDIEEIYDKYIFNDVIVFDSINKDQLLKLSGGMSLIIEDKIRVKKISERLYNINTIMPLNIFVNQKIDRFELSEEIDKVVRDELKENGV